jgi:hypothetical protein
MANSLGEMCPAEENVRKKNIRSEKKQALRSHRTHDHFWVKNRYTNDNKYFKISKVPTMKFRGLQ